MSKSFLRCQRIRLLTIGFFCMLWYRNRSSKGRGTRGRCGLWYPFCMHLLDLSGGGTGGGEDRGGTGGWAGLGWLRLRKCWTWSAGTPAEASNSSSPLPLSGEAVTWPVFY